MRLLKTAFAVGALLWAVPSFAELPISPLKDIYESYNDCFKVATKDGIKPEMLAPLGWQRAKVSGGGKPKADEPIIFGHSARKPIMMLSSPQGDGICIIMARLESRQSFEEFKSAWGGKLPKPDANGAITFFAEGHPIQLRQTGTADKPAMSIVVGMPAKSE